MKILIAGGAGYIGSTLTRQLLQEGYLVTVFDNLLFGGEAIIDLLKHKRFQLIHGDIRSRKHVQLALKNIDLVVNLAALVGEPACKIDPKATEDINYKGAKTLCDLAKNSGVKRFIHISTCSNYGISDTKNPATEDSELRPISLYAETKIAGEKYVIKQTENYFSVCVLRLATVYGISPRMRFDLLINEIVRDAFLNRKIEVYQPLAWRPFVHVNDVGKAVISCINASRKRVNGQIFNIGKKNYQKQEVINHIKKYIPDCEENIIETKVDKRDYCVSFKKVKKALGFEAKINLDTGIKEILTALEYGIFKNPNDYRYTNINWPHLTS